MKLSLILLTCPLGALASLNCTTTAPLAVHCCPNKNSELVKTYPVNATVMIGCAADDTSDGRWFWNYNGLYTPTTQMVKNCVLGTRPYNSTDILPACRVDAFVLQLTQNGTSPLDPCDPKCVTNKSIPKQTWYGDVKKVRRVRQSL